MYRWPEVDFAALRDARMERVSELMREQAVDHLLLSSFDTIRQATDFRATLTYDSNYDYYAALVAADGETTLLACDVGEAIDEPMHGLPWITRRVPTPSWQSLWAHPATYARVLARELERVGARRLGVDVLPFEVAAALRAACPQVELVPVLRELLWARRIKLPDEVRLLEAGCEVLSLCASAAMGGFVEGMTDHEVVTLADETAHKHMVEWISHSVIVAQATPKEAAWLPTGRRIWGGEVFFVDYGVIGRGGYTADFCRTAFAGEPDPVVADAHRKLLDAKAAGEAFARPGVKGSEVARVVNDALRGHGLPPTAYAMGHGIGLRMVEIPSLYREELMDHDDVLEEGMAICIEPSTSVELPSGEVVGLKEEDQYIVTATGLRTLTRTAVA
ncbi:M24 family metallopeptidase [Conexibacter woesei]|uniref:Peptidase M24 n=1 Tax=Conexibacter woesei (strain DSM 14684 / CCUG 47730 / CIP 108061 / JCM 11494 / NBRC 100937 / ID131577) TaxID=469383 RepID=D3F2J6_CONWI|nr:Xaa-Pro peptidase family protein [Conexibacter woesei]ADB52262.1 peptidase M24 [Conexibacter woesei DSM 14684]